MEIFQTPMVGGAHPTEQALSVPNMGANDEQGCVGIFKLRLDGWTAKGLYTGNEKRAMERINSSHAQLHER
jgi:hypothetical protein